SFAPRSVGLTIRSRHWGCSDSGVCGPRGPEAQARAATQTASTRARTKLCSRLSDPRQSDIRSPLSLDEAIFFQPLAKCGYEGRALERPVKTARSAKHAAGNLDNRHATIVCVALPRVNVSVLYQ